MDTSDNYSIPENLQKSHIETILERGGFYLKKETIICTSSIIVH